MSAEITKRKLSAILSADVKGYSRLMEKNEMATIQTLKAYREIIKSIILHYGGRVERERRELGQMKALIEQKEKISELEAEKSYTGSASTDLS